MLTHASWKARIENPGSGGAGLDPTRMKKSEFQSGSK